MNRSRKITSNRDYHEFVINLLPVAIVEVQSDRSITAFNIRASEITGYRPAEAIGRPYNDILSCTPPAVPVNPAQAPGRSVQQVETTLQSKHGETVPIMLNSAIILNEDEKPDHTLYVFQDISRIQALERERRNVLSMVSHDMKSSVSVIGGFVKLLLRKADTLKKDKLKQHLSTMHRELSKMETLTNDFLELSRLAEPGISLNKQPVSLEKILRELIQAFTPKCESRGIHLELKIDTRPPLVAADALGLHRAFSNLLANALKFSPDNGIITITVGKTDAHAIIRFTDSGPGILPEDISGVFDSFHQGRIGGKTHGFGIGLAVVKSVIEQHGGRVRVESRPEQGTTFAVLLPI